MNKLRVGIIGAGHLGRIHTRLMGSLPHVEVVGVVDPIAAARDRAADEFGVSVFSHHNEICERIDAAVVATTTDNHFTVGSDLIAHGVHLLVEKPITTTVEQADELVARANAQRLVLQVGHVERFNPAWRAAAPRVRRPRYIEAVRTSGYTFRSIDIGVVLDLMIHDLDLVLAQIRSDVVEVDAMGQVVFGPHEDMAHAHLRFANGCIANLNASRTSFYAQRTMQMVSDRAYANIDFAERTAKLVSPSKAVLRGEIDLTTISPDERQVFQDKLFTDLLPVRDLNIDECNPILEEQRDFIECIRTGRRPRVCGDQGRRCLAAAEQILASIRAGESRSPLHSRATAVVAGPRWPSTGVAEAGRRRAG